MLIQSILQFCFNWTFVVNFILVQIKTHFYLGFFFWQSQQNCYLNTVVWLLYQSLPLCTKIYKEKACRGRSGMACTEPRPQPIQHIWLNWNTSSESDPCHPTSAAKLDCSHVLRSCPSSSPPRGVEAFLAAQCTLQMSIYFLSTSCLFVFYQHIYSTQCPQRAQQT